MFSGILSGQTWCMAGTEQHIIVVLFPKLADNNCVGFDFGDQSQSPSQSNANTGLLISGSAINRSARSPR